MVSDFIMGTGCFSGDEQARVADKMAEKASRAFMDAFHSAFSDPPVNRVVELALPKGMPHPWSSDPDRDAKVRMEEDGRSKPYRTLAECIESECPKVEPVDAHLAACRERDRADEARAVWRKRWQERGKTIAHLQARLSERKSGAMNASLRKWCKVVEDQRAVLKFQRDEATAETASLKALVSTYEDRIAELTKANKQLDEGYNAAVLAVSEATNKRLDAERRAHFASSQAASGGGEQPLGWLTEEEKAAIRWAMSEGFDEEVLRGLLARSSPPEVQAASRMTPEPGDNAYRMSYIEGYNDAGTLWRAAIEDSGVAVKVTT
jgi:hypothetical protein